jgi:hypothetical protein
MAPPHAQKSLEKEARINLAIHGIKKKQFSSQRNAAEVCKAKRVTMRLRLEGVPPKLRSRAINNLLLQIEEEELVQWILAIERRGFPSYLIDMKRMVEHLISR